MGAVRGGRIGGVLRGCVNFRACYRFRILFLLTCASLSASAVVAPPARTAARAGDKAISLSGTTSFLGRETGMATITLEEQWKVRYTARFRDIELRGGGRVTGLFMREQVGRNPATLYFIRLRSCRERGCDTGKTWTMLFGRWRDELVLPKGRYSLYLISDDARVQATLRRDDSPGQTVVTSLDPVRGQRLIRQPATLPGFFSAGHRFNLHTAGLAISATWPSAQPAGGLSGTCLYEADSGSRLFPYLPGCEIRGAEVEEAYIHPPGRHEPTMSLRELPEGRWDHGAYQLSPGGASRGGLFFTIPF